MRGMAKTNPKSNRSKPKLKKASKGGSLYREEYVETAKNLALLGWPQKEIAAHFGITEHAIIEWMAKYPAFREAIVNGGEIADARVAASLYVRACGFSRRVQTVVGTKEGAEVVDYEAYYPPDVKAAQHWLRNREHSRARWRDAGDVAILVNDELAERLEAARQRVKEKQKESE